MVELIRKKYPFQIQPSTVDFRLKITLSAMTDILLTTAGMNADDNGFGTRKLKQHNTSWVLLRFAMEMKRFPEQYEHITVETWIEEINRLNTTRNFCIRDNEDNIIGYAVSIWVMIDRDSRKPRDLMTLDDFAEFACGDTVPIEKPRKLKSVEGEMFDSFRAKYTHIDFNRHVNTMRYIEWIVNYFDLEYYKQKNIQRFEINFIHELVFGDEVCIFATETEKDDYSFEIRCKEQVSCKAKIVF